MENASLKEKKKEIHLKVPDCAATCSKSFTMHGVTHWAKATLGCGLFVYLIDFLSIPRFSLRFLLHL